MFKLPGSRNPSKAGKLYKMYWENLQNVLGNRTFYTGKLNKIYWVPTQKYTGYLERGYLIFTGFSKSRFIIWTIPYLKNFRVKIKIWSSPYLKSGLVQMLKKTF